MLIHVKSIYKLEKVHNGLGGIILKELPVLEYVKDLSVLCGIRVDDKYKNMGVGTKLFELAVDWSKRNGLEQN